MEGRPLWNYLAGYEHAEEPEPVIVLPPEGSTKSAVDGDAGDTPQYCVPDGYSDGLYVETGFVNFAAGLQNIVEYSIKYCRQDGTFNGETFLAHIKYRGDVLA
jgi:hypothetical protein